MSPETQVVPGGYVTPQWITNVQCWRSPYAPQMGDEVVYFWQGHREYHKVVEKRGISEMFKLKEAQLPWKRMNLQTAEFMRAKDIEYLMGPPTTCRLTLAFLDEESREETGFTCQIRYHDCDGVEDFIILAQHFDDARKNESWQTGDRFRIDISGKWHFGIVKGRRPFDPDHADSLFKCLRCRYFSGESERMSPWELHAIDDINTPETVGKMYYSMHPEDIVDRQYQPQPVDWGGIDHQGECDRIMGCIDQLLTRPNAGPFNGVVNPAVYPDYTSKVPYPTDLAKIKYRLQNRYYRRRSALQWEVKQLAKNAESYNGSDSDITRTAKLFSETLLSVISNRVVKNASSVYQRLQRTGKRRNSSRPASDYPDPGGLDDQGSEQKLVERCLQSGHRVKIDLRRGIDDCLGADEPKDNSPVADGGAPSQSPPEDTGHGESPRDPEDTPGPSGIPRVAGPPSDDEVIEISSEEFSDQSDAEDNDTAKEAKKRPDSPLFDDEMDEDDRREQRANVKASTANITERRRRRLFPPSSPEESSSSSSESEYRAPVLRKRAQKLRKTSRHFRRK